MTGITNLIKSRNSKRSFTDKDLSDEIILDILNTARYTSSGGNIQPWKVTVLRNKKVISQIGEEVSKLILEEADFQQDIQYYPTEWKKEYTYRRAMTGKEFYNVCKINRKNKEERLKSWIDNFYFFEAPVVFLIHLDKIFTESSTGMLMDIGAFMQTILLKCEELGLGTCPQGAIGEYSKVIKKIVDIPDTDALVLAISIGYEDEHVKNTFKPNRIEIEEFVKFIV